ncbi:hypothetical protein [Microcoleus sp. herbarium12]|uniref:hypothetical protein n=1 Tax=Microcoleus sp. herbarium12 TaxID=3055437 RepID=UPI002FCE8A3F
MQEIVETISVVGSSVGLIVSLVGIWNVSKGIVKRLVIIQNKLNSLKGMVFILRGRIDDLEKYLSTGHGYNVRGTVGDIEEIFTNQYDDDDTGF